MTNQTATLFHTIRSEYEQETDYYMLLQETGKLTDDVYFGSKDHDDCLISVGNECNRYINLPSKFVGFERGYAI